MTISILRVSKPAGKRRIHSQEKALPKLQQIFEFDVCQSFAFWMIQNLATTHTVFGTYAEPLAHRLWRANTGLCAVEKSSSPARAE
jgi:hypothetical protein